MLDSLGSRSLLATEGGTSEKAVHLVYNQHIMLLYSLTQHDDCTCSCIDNPTPSCCSVELMACLAVRLYISMTLKSCVYCNLSYYHTKDRHSALICLAKKIHNLKHIFQNRHCKACN